MNHRLESVNNETRGSTMIFENLADCEFMILFFGESIFTLLYFFDTAFNIIGCSYLVQSDWMT